MDRTTKDVMGVGQMEERQVEERRIKEKQIKEKQIEEGQMEMEVKPGADMKADGITDTGSDMEADSKTFARCCCNQKNKKRTGKEERDLLNRLSRVEGQIRGIKSMVEDDRYCVDILTQVSAVQAALNSFNKVLLSSHIKSCVVEDIERGNTEVVDELCKTIQKLMK